MRIKTFWLSWFGPGLLVLGLDRLVKIEYKRNILSFLIHNSGMAFGLLKGNAFPILAVSLLLILMCFFLLRGMRPSGLAPIALSMILGGALGNMIDRLLYGYVLDMFPFFNWFVFNVADVGVVVGAILCGWSLLFRPQDWSKKEQ